MNPIPDSWNDSPAEVRQTVERLHAVVPHLAGRLRADLPLDSCGFDSLEVVELLCAAESACGVRLATEDADARTTGRELLARIAARTPATAGTHRSSPCIPPVIRPRHESQSTQSVDTESTETNASYSPCSPCPSSVDSVSQETQGMSMKSGG